MKLTSSEDPTSEQVGEVMTWTCVREGDGGEERGAISMESMVCLPDPATTPLFHEAIARLKYGNYKQAEDSLLKIIR